MYSICIIYVYDVCVLYIYIYIYVYVKHMELCLHFYLFVYRILETVGSFMTWCMCGGQRTATGVCSLLLLCESL